MQARVRELRMSLERAKPALLPPLKDALSGVVDVDSAGPDISGGMQLPKIQRPPPVMDDVLWDEITTEVVKRKSMHDPSALEEDGEKNKEQELSPSGAPELIEQSEPSASQDDQTSQDPADTGMHAFLASTSILIC